MNSTYSFIAQGTDLDSFGHVNNVVYVRYLECARWNFFHDYELLDGITTDGLFPVILETYIRYIKEIKIFDKVSINTKWQCSDGVILNTHRFINEENGNLHAKAKCKLAFVTKEKIIADVPENVRRIIEGSKK